MKGPVQFCSDQFDCKISFQYHLIFTLLFFNHVENKYIEVYEISPLTPPRHAMVCTIYKYINLPLYQRVDIVFEVEVLRVGHPWE